MKLLYYLRKCEVNRRQKWALGRVIRAQEKAIRLNEAFLSKYHPTLYPLAIEKSEIKADFLPYPYKLYSSNYFSPY